MCPEKAPVTTDGGEEREGREEEKENSNPSNSHSTGRNRQQPPRTAVHQARCRVREAEMNKSQSFPSKSSDLLLQPEKCPCTFVLPETSKEPCILLMFRNYGLTSINRSSKYPHPGSVCTGPEKQLRLWHQPCPQEGPGQSRRQENTNA